MCGWICKWMDLCTKIEHVAIAHVCTEEIKKNPLTHLPPRCTPLVSVRLYENKIFFLPSRPPSNFCTHLSLSLSLSSFSRIPKNVLYSAMLFPACLARSLCLTLIYVYFSALLRPPPPCLSVSLLPRFLYHQPSPPIKNSFLTLRDEGFFFEPFCFPFFFCCRRAAFHRACIPSLSFPNTVRALNWMCSARTNFHGNYSDADYDDDDDDAAADTDDDGLMRI